MTKCLIYILYVHFKKNGNLQPFFISDEEEKPSIHLSSDDSDDSVKSLESIDKVLKRRNKMRTRDAIANGLRRSRRKMYATDEDDQTTDEDDDEDEHDRKRKKKHSTRFASAEKRCKISYKDAKNCDSDNSSENEPLLKENSKNGKKQPQSDEASSDALGKKNGKQSSKSKNSLCSKEEEVLNGDIKEEIDIKKEEVTLLNRHGREYNGLPISMEQPLLISGGIMKPYQIEGMIWMANLRKIGANGILADEMGLGKTLQTISLFCHCYEVDKKAGPFLVIAPLSTLRNWKREVERFAPGVPVKVWYLFILHGGFRIYRKITGNYLENNFSIEITKSESMKKFASLRP